MPSRDESDSLLYSINSMTVHTIPLNQLFSQLQSSPEGLDHKDCKQIRMKIGLNKVPPPLSAPAWLCCLLPCLLRTNAMMEYNEVVPDQAFVKRDKNWIKMDSTSLVPGDVVMVRDGERVPADIRVFEASSNCQFDVSSVFGDSSRRSCSIKESNSEYLESPNMAFLGFLCIEGNCKGIVVSTSDKTVIGSMINQKKWPPKSPSS